MDKSGLCIKMAAADDQWYYSRAEDDFMGMKAGNENQENEFHPLLPIYLKILALILFFYWGITHLIYPEWYLVTLMGITEYDPSNTYDVWSANLTGVLNIGFAITIWRVSHDPVRFKPVLDMILIVSIGTLAVFIFSLVRRDLSPREWINVGLIAGSVLILLILYPKSGKG